MDMTRLRRDGAQVVAVGRIAIGASMLARPGLLPRTVGADRVTAERVSWLTRMAGIREVALGAGTLRALRGGGDARPWVAASAACDAVDALVFAGAVRARRVHPALGVGVVLAAAASTATNLLGLPES